MKSHVKGQGKMKRYTRFKDIPKFISDGNYAVDMQPIYMMGWIADEIKEMDLKLEPNFQRGHIWTPQQQSAFIEYFLRGGKSGMVLYFNLPSWHHPVPKGNYNEYVCVDGLQRITAWKKFFDNELEVFGSLYCEYEDKLRAGQTMRIVVNDLKTEKDVLQWYIDMNAGGTPHSNEEINRVKELMAGL